MLRNLHRSMFQGNVMSAANQTNQPSLSQSTPTRTRSMLLPVLQGLTAVAVVLAAITMMVYLVRGVEWRRTPFIGVHTTYTLVVDGTQTFTDGHWAGLQAGIRRGDRLVQVNDVDLFSSGATDYAAARATLKDTLAGLGYGDTVIVGFVRTITDPDLRESADPFEVDGVACDAPVNGVSRCTVSYPMAPLPDGDFLTYFAIPFVTGIIALVIGAGLLFLRPNEPNALLIAMFCVSLGVFTTGTYNNSTSHVWMPLWLSFTTIGGVVGYVLALVFPNQSSLTLRFPSLLMIPPVLGGLALAYVLNSYFNPATPQAGLNIWLIPVGVAASSFIALLVAFIWRRRLVASSIQRDQINTSLIGLGLAFIPVVLWLISTVAIIIDNTMVLPFNSATVMPFFITIPISLAYSVLQYRGFNSERILGEGITYGIMMGGLVVGYSLLVFGVNTLIFDVMFGSSSATVDTATNPFIIGAVIFAIAVLFLPFRTRLQRQIDAIYYREQREYVERAEAFTHQISSTRNFAHILRLYVTTVKDVMNTRSVFIFLPDEESTDYLAHHLSDPQTDVRFEAKSPLLRLLARTTETLKIPVDNAWEPGLISERARLKMLKAHLIVPLRAGRTDINGFVIIGPPQNNGQPYTYQSLRFLDNLSTQMAIAVERAQVVESLERRVRELGVLSSVSQAVNFAVEYDDLLELISNQTQKLIEASHFYIALQDASAGQMYYAFFLEDNERLRERENQRWFTGKDLYARIIEQGQAERHDDYTVVVKSGGFSMRHVSDEVRSWMGVPLVAGATRLGVMAVGTTRTGYSYSDEQLKIFNDIGALAATSIDKARLFEETNQRARQLRALNDISRGLQSERKLEVLLPLITSSAVDILEAEAGSLLLVAEDDSGDLIFRVVIGGGGEDLLNKRIPAGTGLVGQVATESKPVIVNNTSEDARWAQDISKSTGFHTDAILAVPLIANNQVIGVLEMINKRDGGVFVKDDADLLETFSGQAAIAIENARLFQTQDEQIVARLRELETLERIDKELNRTLDLHRVAEITIKWAVANSAATAGLLGVVTEESPPRLEVLASYGYTEQDAPDGAEDNYWPLNKGIVSRVMRTKQPEVQSPLDIDPDYIPSLGRSNSQITVPMLAGGEIIAMLILEKNTEPRLNILDLDFVQRLADHAAIAIENARLLAELNQANQTQSRFMGIGAHELKNALAPIRGWTDLIKSGALGPINEQQSNYLGVVKANADRAKTIIDDLRDFAKMRADELRVTLEPISFRNVVIETLATFTNQIEEKDQELVNDVREDLPLVMGDQGRLIQVMTNFISNANKYSPSGAKITLGAEVIHDMKDEKGRNIGDFLHISVADTGIGISDEDMKKLFTPYFRSTNEEALDKPGTGLGMSLTKNLIEQHGGRVWVNSVLGEGTTFNFTLPLAPAEEPANPEAESEPASD